MNQSSSEDSERTSSWTCYGITHFLSRQQDQNGGTTVRRHQVGSAMKLLTSCQGTKTRVEVKMVRRHTGGPAMKSLTPYQGNIIRLGVKTVRRHQS